MRFRDLFEGPLSPIPKTDRFIRFHGNYCGPGNRGGDPVDDLDHACMKHDVGYHYTPDPAKRLKHDASFIKKVHAISTDTNQPRAVRVKAKMIKSYFQWKINKMKFQEAFDREENEDYWKSMPSEHLHAETHRVMSEHGFRRVGDNVWDPTHGGDLRRITDVHGALKSQGWRWPEMGGPIRHPNGSILMRLGFGYRFIHPMKEDATPGVAINNAGAGNVDGVGVGPRGEPGVKTRRRGVLRRLTRGPLDVR